MHYIRQIKQISVVNVKLCDTDQNNPIGYLT